MKKMFTIIDMFAIEDYAEPDQCWVANFSSKEIAIKAFAFKLKECGALDENGLVTSEIGEKTSVEQLFNDLLTNGNVFKTTNETTDNWFIRGERVNDKFDDEIETFISFD